ncbi:hypothetical protein TNCV_736341 [Trichonephila clavipes]|nr:hypothetical protein TNCV_736341 [Trichonephila clavipes]
MLPVLGKKAVLEWCMEEGLIGSSYVCPKCGTSMGKKERPAEMGESNDVPLDAEALKISSAGVDVSESAIPVNAPPNMPKVSKYGRTIQRSWILNVFNVTTVFESE